MQLMLSSDDFNSAPQEVRSWITSKLYGADVATPAIPEAKEPVEKKSRAKKEKEVEVEKEADDDLFGDSTPAKEAVTKDSLNAMVTELLKGGKRAEVVASLAKVGAKKLTDVSEDKYAELAALLAVA